MTKRLYNEYSCLRSDTAEVRAEADALIQKAFDLLARQNGFCPVDVEQYLGSTLGSIGAEFRILRAMSMRKAERELTKTP